MHYYKRFIHENITFKSDILNEDQPKLTISRRDCLDDEFRCSLFISILSVNIHVLFHELQIYNALQILSQIAHDM